MNSVKCTNAKRYQKLKLSRKLLYQRVLASKLKKKYTTELAQKLSLKYRMRLAPQLKIKYKEQLAPHLKIRYSNELASQLKVKYRSELASKLKSKYREELVAPLLRIKYQNELAPHLRSKYRNELAPLLRSKYRNELALKLAVKYRKELAHQLKMKYKNCLASQLKMKHKNVLAPLLKRKYKEIIAQKLKDKYKGVLSKELKKNCLTEISTNIENNRRKVDKTHLKIQHKVQLAAKHKRWYERHRKLRMMSMFNERSRLHPREKHQKSSMQRQRQSLFYCRERSPQNTGSPKSHKTFSHNQIPVISIANKKNYQKSRERQIFFLNNYVCSVTSCYQASPLIALAAPGFFSDGVKYWKPSDEEYLPDELKLCTENSTNSATICWTCSKALKKGNVPPMLVKKKLELEELSEVLKLTDLEHQLVAKDLLFLKVFSLPRTRMYAVKDRVINVPLTNDDIVATTNILPRSTADNFLVNVKLKRTCALKMFIRNPSSALKL